MECGASAPTYAWHVKGVMKGFRRGFQCFWEGVSEGVSEGLQGGFRRVSEGFRGFPMNITCLCSTKTRNASLRKCLKTYLFYNENVFRANHTPNNNALLSGGFQMSPQPPFILLKGEYTCQRGCGPTVHTLLEFYGRGAPRGGLSVCVLVRPSFRLSACSCVCPSVCA